jgi:RimJ/RimL family protein N-acetyltransferase
MDWTFGTLGWRDAAHVIHPENLRSQALARRLGSVKRGMCRLPPPFEAEELELWGQDRASWQAAARRFGATGAAG